jgi:hypothetical protein
LAPIVTALHWDELSDRTAPQDQSSERSPGASFGALTRGILASLLITARHLNSEHGISSRNATTIGAKPNSDTDDDGLLLH